MINIENDKLMTLAEAARTLPRRRRGSRPHASTLYRWATRGLGGVRLEVIRVGGTLCTSQAALQSFFQELTESNDAYFLGVSLTKESVPPSGSTGKASHG